MFLSELSSFSKSKGLVEHGYGTILLGSVGLSRGLKKL